ncbi:MAG TPA: hypothetical protein VIY47_08955, partial [Ignavibacteriaceae bacterium]
KKLLYWAKVERSSDSRSLPLQEVLIEAAKFTAKDCMHIWMDKTIYVTEHRTRKRYDETTSIVTTD